MPQRWWFWWWFWRPWLVLGELSPTGTTTWYDVVPGRSTPRLLALSANAVLPTWSHDGSRVAYADAFDMSVSNVCVAAADGSSPTALTPGWGPTWTPSNTLVFVRWSSTGANTVCEVAAAGGAVTELFGVPSPHVIAGASCSPDGTQIAYTYSTSTVNSIDQFEVYVAARDGSSARSVWGGPVYDMLPPLWSPDGAWLIVQDATQDGSPVDQAFRLIDVAAGGAVSLPPAQSWAWRPPTWWEAIAARLFSWRPAAAAATPGDGTVQLSRPPDAFSATLQAPPPYASGYVTWHR